MYFEDLDLSDEVLDALWDMHFDEPTPVQAQTIPVILDGHDVISCAQTGTGKTAAYILPLLTNMQRDGHDENKLNAIIMAPTRELAQQIDQQMEGFGYYVPFRSVPIYGGNDAQAWSSQMRGLQTGADIVIATPGRLLSHMNIYDIDFSGVKYFILDEADRMLDMGFYDDIMTIFNRLPKQKQTIMFSATMPQKIRQMAKAIMLNPTEVKIAISRPPETIRQMMCRCFDPQKPKIILSLLKGKNLTKVIVFVGKKSKVRTLVQQLRSAGIDARAMYSDLEQKERDEVMLAFRNGKVEVLVATDIVARGIDVDDVPLVINYDVPHDAEDYVHRIGRTARAANSGEAVTLVSVEDSRYFARIEAFLKKQVEQLPLPEGMETPLEYVPEQKKNKKKNNHKKQYKNGKSNSTTRKRNSSVKRRREV